MLEEIINTKSFYKKAKRLLPSDVFSFIDAGSFDEFTLRRNRKAFEKYLLLPRVLRGLDEVSTQINLFGHKLSAPILIAPTAYQQLVSQRGELDMLEAVNQFNTIFVVSMFSSVDYELLSKNDKKKSLWLQMYFLKDREINKNFIQTAQELEFQAIVLTVDTPVYAKREREKSCPLNFPASTTFPHLKKIGIPFEEGLKTKGHLSNLLDHKISWSDVEWLAHQTHLPIILKGIMDPRDTQIALTYPNVKGIIVSNHGGRQLDSSFSSLELIQRHKEIAGNKIKVLLDGGISRGSDIFKALALGADATLIGRTALWALSVGGSAGVLHALTTLQNELLQVMTLCGCSSISEITHEFITEGKTNEKRKFD